MRETNLYRLLNLDRLSARYQLFEISGEYERGPEYYAGITRLQRRLSRKHGAAIAPLQRGDQMLLAVPEPVCNQLEKNQDMGRWLATLKPVGAPLDIDFVESGDEKDPIRLRFLNFMLQSWLFDNKELWQPRAGDAFFYRRPSKTIGNVNLYEGVGIRAVSYPGGGFGVILDVRVKMISQHSLGADASPDAIRRLRNSSCLYRMGGHWYEIKVAGAGPILSECKFKANGEWVSLKEHIHRILPKPLPQHIANLDGDGSVITYRGSDAADVKAAPAALCFRVLDTHTKAGAKLQRETILPPAARRSKAYKFKKKFLAEIAIGDVSLSVDDKSARATEHIFDLPNLLFGKDRRLNGTGAQSLRVNPRDYAKKRRTLLEDKSAGFYEDSPLDAQTLVMPQSVMDTWGPKFVEDLVSSVKNLHPNSNYNPTVVTFDDVSSRITPSSQAIAILKLAQDNAIPPGDCAIMVHPQSGRTRKEEELPALLINKLREPFGIHASVFHTTVPRQAYRQESAEAGAPYIRKQDAKGQFAGYLKGAALNKVLLPNAKWPFVLSQELYADLVIGIDVKQHTAALVLIAEGGRIITPNLELSDKKEKLPAGLVAAKLKTLIQDEASSVGRLPKTIAIHRDGRVFPSELKGLQNACEALATEGLLHERFELSVFEIVKSSPAPLRFFRVDLKKGERPTVDNPRLGEWMALTEDEGFVCTTGAPLLRAGTARPLHVRRVSGEMAMNHALGDIFRLSCLTWTRPESCSRLPVSLKLCDTFLMDRGADQNETDLLYANDDEKAA
jgi:hypothetical protein